MIPQGHWKSSETDRYFAICTQVSKKKKKMLIAQLFEGMLFFELIIVIMESCAKFGKAGNSAAHSAGWSKVEKCLWALGLLMVFPLKSEKKIKSIP